ncbi:MAG: DUF5312 family protein [Treponema sp.]|jgi:hypothetical protein|nr:DUF5312 family protein [Treponema sp.]
MAEDLMDKVFSFFSGEGLDDDKQNMLRQIAKELNQNKYSKFFHVRTEEVDPSFSSFIFSIYKVIFPIKVFFKDDKKVARLRNMTIESCIDDNIKATIKQLDYAALDEKAKTMSGEELITLIQANVEKLVSQFDQNRISVVDHRYELAASLAQFVAYNFSGFFKKFDSHFIDGSFLIEPKFPTIKTILIVDQIGEFMSVTQSLRPEDDWKGLISLINSCEGKELVTAEQFITMITMLREVHTSKIMELMVQYTLRNPLWQWKHIYHHETIGEEWLEFKKSEAAAYITKINNAKKNVQISALLKQIFEATDLVRLENYTVHHSEAYRRKNVECFDYAEGLNYLKAFLDDYIEKEFKELCDILLIRGQWTNNTMAMEMSEALHALLDALEPIATLDAELSDDGADGSRLRAALLRVDRDQTQVRYINSIVTKNNDEAVEIINEAAQNLIVIGKHLKNLIDDVQKKHPELLINWKEINLASKEPIAQRMVGDYKRLNYFVQLMHLCTLV